MGNIIKVVKIEKIMAFLIYIFLLLFVSNIILDYFTGTGLIKSIVVTFILFIMTITVPYYIWKIRKKNRKDKLYILIILVVIITFSYLIVTRGYRIIEDIKEGSNTIISRDYKVGSKRTKFNPFGFQYYIELNNGNSVIRYQLTSGEYDQLHGENTPLTVTYWEHIKHLKSFEFYK